MSETVSMLEMLQNRASVPARMLGEPGPTADQIREAVRAAVSAPDHATLRPWHFVVVEGEPRNRLAALFGQALKTRNPEATEEEIQAEAQKALRSPCIVVVYVTIDPDNPKVPPVEQVVSGGAAAQNLLLAFDAMGFGSVILTGANSRDPGVKRALGIPDGAEVIGFINVGTPPDKVPNKRRLDGDDFDGHLSFWQG